MASAERFLHMDIINTVICPIFYASVTPFISLETENTPGFFSFVTLHARRVWRASEILIHPAQVCIPDIPAL